MSAIINGMGELSRGNLDYRIEVDGKSEFAEICEQFNSLASRLQESEEMVKRHEDSKHDVLVGISHDLGTPLTSIQAYTEGILDGVANTPEKQKHYLEMIKDKAEDIQSLVTQIVMFSELKREDYPYHPIEMRLDKEIEKLIELQGKEYEERGLRIKGNLKPTVIQADPEYLYRILINIIENSIKYRKKEVGTLEITLDESGNCHCLICEDDGPGVTEEALPKLFEVFYRTDPARSMPGKGSGIGLAIVKILMEKMGGSVRAEIGNQGGLKIILSFP